MIIRKKYRFWFKSKTDGYVHILDCEGEFNYALKQVKKTYDYTKDYDIVKVSLFTSEVSDWKEEQS